MVAHDCGQIITPDLLRQCIEGNVVQSISRALWEEVKFDSKSVTSVDWQTYPILDITETPETIDIVLIDHPDQPPTGAGEPTHPTARGGDRQRDLRRDRRAAAPGAVHAGPAEGGAVVGIRNTHGPSSPAKAGDPVTTRAVFTGSPAFAGTGTR